MKLLESGLDVFGYRQMKKLAINAVCVCRQFPSNESNECVQGSKPLIPVRPSLLLLLRIGLSLYSVCKLTV